MGYNNIKRYLGTTRESIKKEDYTAWTRQSTKHL